jgi:hypothetical protein
MGFSFTWHSNDILYTSLFIICRFWIRFFSILTYFFGITWVFIESCVIRVSFHSFRIAFFKIFSSDIQFCLFLNLTKYDKIEKNRIQNLQIINKEVYKISLECQVKEKPIAYTKWEKCIKKDRMHTLTCITQTLFFTFNYLELNKLKIFKWKLIHFTIPFIICRFWIWFFSILAYFFGITWVFIESCVIRVSFHSFRIAFFKIFSSDIQFCLFLNLTKILYSEIWPYSSKIH